MTENRTPLAVIGAGPGGYAAAFLAADMGMSVTLIDPEKTPGGVCLHRGCIPSKALLHVARHITETKEAGSWGVFYDNPKIDLDLMRKWKANIVISLTDGLKRLVDQRKIDYVRAKAAFLDEKTLALADEAGNTGTLTFEHAIIATGSSTTRLPIFADDTERIWYSKHALDLRMIPDSLLVVGGGYIGLELASVYAALGSRVSVVEMLPNLLSGVDRDLVRFLSKRLTDRFDKILVNTTVEKAEIREHGVRITFQERDKAPVDQTFQRILVAVGRSPNTAELGLDKAKVMVDKAGFIHTDDQCRTASRRIFAVGDVAGQPMLAHKASYEARIAVETIAGKNVIADPVAIPAVVFTDPEIAWAGFTENKAKEKGVSAEIIRYPWAASGRAVATGKSDGLTKLLIDPKTQRLIGAGIVGSGAGELIAEATLGMEMGANAADLGLTIHPHPTLSETLKEAADVYHGIATHFYRPKRKKKE